VKKKIIIVILLVIVAIGGTLSGYALGVASQKTTTPTAPKKKKETKQEKEVIQGDTPKSPKVVSSDEQEKQDAILAINKKVVEAYFEYTSSEARIKQILTVSSQEFQKKLEEASGVSGEVVKSHVVSTSAYIDMTSILHPEVVNLVTNRVAINGQTYEQTTYARYQFTNEANQWKLASVALTPIQDTQKVQ
jgi:hypothetical protein